MNEKIEWVTQLPLPQPFSTTRKGMGKTQAFVRALQSNPNVWAVYPYATKCSTNKYKQLHPGTDWCSRRIDGVRVVYARWVGETK